MNALRTRERRAGESPYPTAFGKMERNSAVETLGRIQQVLRTFERAEDVHSYVDWSKMSNDLDTIIRQLRDGLEEV